MRQRRWKPRAQAHRAARAPSAAPRRRAPAHPRRHRAHAERRPAPGRLEHPRHGDLRRHGRQSRRLCRVPGLVSALVEIRRKPRDERWQHRHASPPDRLSAHDLHHAGRERARRGGERRKGRPTNGEADSGLKVLRRPASSDQFVNRLRQHLPPRTGGAACLLMAAAGGRRRPSSCASTWGRIAAQLAQAHEKRLSAAVSRLLSAWHSPARVCPFARYLGTPTVPAEHRNLRCRSLDWRRPRARPGCQLRPSSPALAYRRRSALAAVPRPGDGRRPRLADPLAKDAATSSGSTREHVLFFAYGTGRNAKMTFVEVLSGVLGTYARNMPAETFIETRQGTATRPNLPPCSVAIAWSPPPKSNAARAGTRPASSELTGGDTISARLMRCRTSSSTNRSSNCSSAATSGRRYARSMRPCGDAFTCRPYDNHPGARA